MSRATVGDFQITLARAGIYHWDGGAVFGVVPKTLWSKRLPSDERNLVPLGFNCYVIETGEHTVLVETGGGDKLDARARERMKLPDSLPPLPDMLASQGIDPERIDVVINSHLHWDHCGGNTRMVNGVATASFPRAAYYTSRSEWEHAHTRHPRDSVSYVDANYDPLVNSGQMTLLPDDTEVIPGISVHAALGHNRDMMVVTATSGGRTFCFFSDLIPSEAHVTPTWVAAFDLYPLECIDTKTRWLNRAAEENWICGFAHDSKVAFGRIVRDETKFSLIDES